MVVAFRPVGDLPHIIGIGFVHARVEEQPPLHYLPYSQKHLGAALGIGIRQLNDVEAHLIDPLSEGLPG